MTLKSFESFVNFDADRATPWQRAVVGLAGPVSSLLLGSAAWFAYRATSLRSTTALPLLYLAACGVSNFFGNMMSAAFLGDFSNVAKWLELPMAQRYALSATGAVVAASVLFVAGRELARWRSPQRGRAAAALEAVVYPVLVGTAIVIVINQPTPIQGFAAARAGEAVFWVCAAAGTFMAVRSSTGEAAPLQLQWRDGAVAMLLLVVVRVMALGIRLN